ncbi:methyltransferase domain-containing protein [Streptomyces sp. NPDC050617]|uniref:methyltransferase domain-containing protein n=1 Tax=Streptomyces sp. NPDC050617 TaxID=3154628 RepID=UPI00342AAFE2
MTADMTADMSTDFTALRAQAAETLGGLGAFAQPWLRRAFESVPRHAFIPDTVWAEDQDGYRAFGRTQDPRRWAAMAYDPRDGLVTQVDDGRTPANGVGTLPTCSISAPDAVLSMLAEADLRPSDTVLEIGTGTGYNAALIARRVGGDSVVTVEIDASLHAGARAALSAAGYGNVTAVRADGEAGYPSRAPYDRVLSTAAVLTVPYAWVEQTRAGGLILTPFRTAFCSHGLARLTVEDGTASGRFAGAMTFMTVRGQRPRSPIGELFTDGTWQEARESAGDGGADRLALTDPHAVFAIGLRLPGVAHWEQGDAHWWCSPDSWAYAAGGSVRQWGPRDLHDETRAAADWWRDQGRPSLFDFGLTVTESGQTAWLGDPGSPLP